MKEVKFRAWDKMGQRLVMPDDILLIDFEAEVLSYKEKRYADNGICLGFYAVKSLIKQFEILQFTGLKDKNGTEIYEGDIVKAWSEGKSAVGKVMQRIDGLWLLYPAWQGKEFWGLCPNNKGNTTVEVIGNIYENPELLNN